MNTEYVRVAKVFVLSRKPGQPKVDEGKVTLFEARGIGLDEGQLLLSRDPLGKIEDRASCNGTLSEANDGNIAGRWILNEKEGLARKFR